MKNKLSCICASFKTTMVLMFIYIAGLSTATWIEKCHGASAAREWIYHALPFLLLQLLLVLNFIGVAIRLHLLKKERIGFVLTHGALIVIMFGALVTFLFGKEGYMHIRKVKLPMSL